MYHWSGYNWLQTLFLNKILADETGITDARIEIEYIPMATAEYVEDDFLMGTKDTMPFFMVLALIAPFVRLISFIVNEKVRCDMMNMLIE